MRGTLLMCVSGIFMSFLLVQCKNQQSTTSNGNGNETPTETMSTPEKLAVDENFSAPAENGSFKVESLSIDGDIVTMVISYSGGCEEHEFELVTNKLYLKSMPPKLNLFLKHNNNGDACRKLVIDTLRYDVSPARYPSPNTKEVVLMFNNTKEVLHYKYE